MTREPPRMAAWLVERSLPRDRSERDAVMGDLAEEHADMHARDGARAADAWYWRQTLASIRPNLVRRFTRPRDPHPRARRRETMASMLQDVRYGWRMVRRRPMMTGVALASLVTGVSLCAVVFSLLDAVLLRPLPVADPDSLAVLLEQRQDGTNHNFSYPDFADYRAAQRTLIDLAAYSRADITVFDPAGSHIVAGELVSGSYFRTLGIRMLFGRGITDEDDRPGSAPVVVVGAGLWRRVAGEGSDRFAPRAIRLNARDFSIVGVAAAPFRGMEVGRDAVLWAPLHAQPVLDPSGGRNLVPRRGTSWLTVIGRLQRGMTRERAAADLRVADVSVAKAGGRDRPRGLFFAAGRQGDSALPRMTAPALELLLGTAILVLLIACANVANLLLARAAERSHEIAVRSALGAGRGRLARLVVIETLLLSAVGAAASLMAARWMTDLALPFMSRFGDPVTLDVGLDWRLVLFVCGVTAGAALLSTLVPMLGALRSAPVQSLGEAGRSASTGPAGNRLRSALVVVQFAVSLALIVAASLLARTVYNLRSVPAGFDMQHVALIGVDPEAAQLDAAHTGTYINAAMERVASVAGVTAAGFGRVVPLGFGGARETISVPDYRAAPDEDMEVNFNVVSPSYFDVMGIPLVDGRPFDAQDDDGRPAVAIVNETMAARYWPARSAIGRRMTMGNDTVEIVGVAHDVKYRALREAAGPSFYLPLAQNRARSGVIHVRTAGDPRVLLGTLRRVVADVDGSVPVTFVRTLREQATANFNDERMAMTIGLTLGAAALLLAAGGLFGSMSYVVGQRRRELGVRIALGASARDVRRLVLRQGIALSAAGSVLGVALAVWLGLALESRLFGVTPADVPTLLASGALLFAVALAASWAPARRAGRVNPVEALRVD